MLKGRVVLQPTTLLFRRLLLTAPDSRFWPSTVETETLHRQKTRLSLIVFFSTREHVSNRNLPSMHSNLRKVIIKTQILHICGKFQCTLCWLFFEPESACSSSLFYQTGVLVSCYSPQTLILSQITGALLISLFGAVQKYILEFLKDRLCRQ